MAERKFKVKCIAISLKKNKIARVTEEVTESQLAGDPDVLIKGKYIVETKSSLKMVKDAKAKADADAKAKADADAKAKADADAKDKEAAEANTTK